HGVPQVQVHLRGVEAAVDAEGAVLLQPCAQFALHGAAEGVVAELGPGHEDGELLVHGGHLPAGGGGHANHSRVAATSARICATSASGPSNFCSVRSMWSSSMVTTCP